MYKQCKLFWHWACLHVRGLREIGYGLRVLLDLVTRIWALRSCIDTEATACVKNTYVSGILDMALSFSCNTVVSVQQQGPQFMFACFFSFSFFSLLSTHFFFFFSESKS